MEKQKNCTIIHYRYLHMIFFFCAHFSYIIRIDGFFLTMKNNEKSNSYFPLD